MYYLKHSGIVYLIIIVISSAIINLNSSEGSGGLTITNGFYEGVGFFISSSICSNPSIFSALSLSTKTGNI